MRSMLPKMKKVPQIPAFKHKHYSLVVNVCDAVLPTSSLYMLNASETSRYSHDLLESLFEWVLR